MAVYREEIAAMTRSEFAESTDPAVAQAARDAQAEVDGDRALMKHIRESRGLTPVEEDG